MESAQSIERKFLARDNSNLTDKFAKSHARDALWRGFRRAQEEHRCSRSMLTWQCGVIGMGVCGDES